MSGRIGTVLQQVGDVADAQLLAPPDVVRARGNQRRHRATLGTAIGVAFACFALVLALATLSTSDGIRQIEPAPSPSSTPTARPDESPQQHPIATEGHRFSAHALAAHDGTVVVVGDSSELVKEPGPPIYWSDNGVEWSAPPAGKGPDSVNVTDVIATSDGFLAVGLGASGNPAAWRSPDGRTWVESPVTASRQPGRGGLWGITSTRLGYFAWGTDDRSAQLWRSVDGKEWAPVDENVFDLPRTETICAVRDTSGGLTATGVEAPANSRAGHQVTWTSADGETWVLTEPAGEATFWCDPTEELGHWEARSDAGLVSIYHYGEGDTVELVPNAP